MIVYHNYGTKEKRYYYSVDTRCRSVSYFINTHKYTVHSNFFIDKDIRLGFDYYQYGNIRYTYTGCRIWFY